MNILLLVLDYVYVCVHFCIVIILKFIWSISSLNSVVTFFNLIKKIMDSNLEDKRFLDFTGRHLII
jgi:hypothetical protein